MPKLELSDEESAVLADLLESAVGDLGYEIANTDSQDFRDGLKTRKAIANAILARLRGGG